jgi:hypothetical protein
MAMDAGRSDFLRLLLMDPTGDDRNLGMRKG